MGAVLRAVDCDIRREVAVKYLLDQTDPAEKARFVEEAQITGQLEHPNIVPDPRTGHRCAEAAVLLDENGQGPQPGPGARRAAARTRKRPRRNISLSRLLNVLVSVCNALAYAHSRGVVHRDLKPANIMLGDFGEVYVMDWGWPRSWTAARRQAAR